MRFKKSFATLFIGMLILFSGCTAQKELDATKQNSPKMLDENLYAMIALELELKNQPDESSTIFNLLYEKTSNKEYLYHSLKNDIKSKNSMDIVKKIDKFLQDDGKNTELLRIKFEALMKMEKFTDAKEVALGLAEFTKSEKDYLLASEASVKLKEYDVAVKYLESAYVKEYGEKILDKMALLLYVNLNKKQDAITMLETHIRLYSCSEFICERLIGFYSNEGNVEALLSTYLRLYNINKKRDIALKIVQTYAYKKDFATMIQFLEQNKIEDELLLQLYMQEKKYDKAIFMTNKLYEESADVMFLGQNAILEYEMAKDKNDKKMQQSVTQKLEKVAKEKKIGMYMNYLGYILIDHDIDIKKGIKHVKDALVLEPNSIFFLDSLAWGYYKLSKCKEADEIMQSIVKAGGGDNDEVVVHIKKIKECIKGKK